MKNGDNQKAIGIFIKKLVRKALFDSRELAERLKTSQSAVARMEAGGQNITAGELLKIGDALEHKIVSLSDSIDFKIIGGKKLKGAIKQILPKMEYGSFVCFSFE